MSNQQPLDLFKQGVATTWNKWREEHTGTAEPGRSGAREPEECCQPNGGIIPLGTLATQPPDDWCRPHRGRGVLHPVGTRGGCLPSFPDAVGTSHQDADGHFLSFHDSVVKNH